MLPCVSARMIVKVDLGRYGRECWYGHDARIGVFSERLVCLSWRLVFQINTSGFVSINEATPLLLLHSVFSQGHPRDNVYCDATLILIVGLFVSARSITSSDSCASCPATTHCVQWWLGSLDPRSVLSCRCSGCVWDQRRHR